MNKLNTATQNLEPHHSISTGAELATTKGSQDAASTPPTALGPQPRPTQTTDELLADLRKHPMFMTELDANAAEDNETLAALQALAYEGTPREKAANFKEQGNECFREKRFGDAKEFYGRGLVILSTEEKRRARGERRERIEESEPEPDAEDEVAAERSLLEQLHVNRAACHLELGNYRACILDCAAVLQLNPHSVKALYRSARALLALDRIAEAEDACTRGLVLDGRNVPLQRLQRDISGRALRVAERAAEEAEAGRRAKLVRAALRARKIRTRTTEKPPEMEDAKLQLLLDADGETSSLSFPTVLLYPAHMQSDFIKAFGERESLERHFEYVFPLPWDREGVYETRGVECYMEKAGGEGLIKVGRKVPLFKVLTEGGVEVVDELVRIYVVPKGRAEEWAREWKAKKGAK